MRWRYPPIREIGCNCCCCCSAAALLLVETLTPRTPHAGGHVRVYIPRAESPESSARANTNLSFAAGESREGTGRGEGFVAALYSERRIRRSARGWTRGPNGFTQNAVLEETREQRRRCYKISSTTLCESAERERVRVRQRGPVPRRPSWKSEVRLCYAS